MDGYEDDIIIEPERGVGGGSEEEIEAVESRTDAKAAKLKRELEACKKERQEYLDGWQRAKADYVNALKRFEDEKEGIASRSTLKAIAVLLPAFDSLERAKAAGAMPEGFSGIARQLEDAFGNFGLQPLGEVGEAFDPVRHEALGSDPTDKKGQDDTVSAVLEPGYRVGDAVLRPAKVRVFHYEG